MKTEVTSQSPTVLSFLSHQDLLYRLQTSRARNFPFFTTARKIGKVLPDLLEIHCFGGMEGIFFGFAPFSNPDVHPFYVVSNLPFQIVGLSFSISFQRHVTVFPNDYWLTVSGRIDGSLNLDPTELGSTWSTSAPFQIHAFSVVEVVRLQVLRRCACFIRS